MPVAQVLQVALHQAALQQDAVELTQIVSHTTQTHKSAVTTHLLLQLVCAKN